MIICICTVIIFICDSLYRQKGKTTSPLVNILYLSQLQGMDQELFGAPSSFRNPMSTKIRLYRRDLAKLQRDIRSLTGSSGLSGHFGDGRQGIYSAENDQSVSTVLPLFILLPLYHSKPFQR